MKRLTLDMFQSGNLITTAPVLKGEDPWRLACIKRTIIAKPQDSYWNATVCYEWPWSESEMKDLNIAVGIDSKYGWTFYTDPKYYSMPSAMMIEKINSVAERLGILEL